MPCLLAALSSHGHGHLVQAAPALQALVDGISGLELVIQSTLPGELIAAKLRRPFRLVDELVDPGMPMHDPIHVDVEGGCTAYRILVEHWHELLAVQIEMTRRVAPDLVLSDVAFLPLAAAQALRLPNVALCSLHWADIYRSYCQGFAGAGEIEARLRACYRRANHFLCPAPSMPMEDLPNVRSVGTLAEIGRERRVELRSRLGVATDARLVMVSLGGTPGDLPVAAWDTPPGVVWLLPDQWPAASPASRHFGTLEWPFEDVLRSCDAIVTKPGYGAFSAAACNGVPVVTAPRPEWPETPAMFRWAKSNLVLREVSLAILRGAGPGEALLDVWQAPPPPLFQPTGARDVFRVLAPLLGHVSVTTASGLLTD